MAIVWYKLITRKEPPCDFCRKAKELLDLNGIDYWEVDITEAGVKEMFAERGFRTVPQVFREEQHIGGFIALEQHIKELNIDRERKHKLGPSGSSKAGREEGKGTVYHSA